MDPMGPDDTCRRQVVNVLLSFFGREGGVLPPGLRFSAYSCFPSTKLHAGTSMSGNCLANPSAKSYTLCFIFRAAAKPGRFSTDLIPMVNDPTLSRMKTAQGSSLRVLRPTFHFPSRGGISTHFP